MELEDIVNEEMLTTEDVNNMLEHTDKGRTKQTIRNCVTALQNDPVLKKAIKRNELSGRMDIVKEVPWERRSESLTVTDTDDSNLKMYLEDNYEITSERVIKKGVDIVSNENKYHPIRDYLESLMWDGVPRIENLLPRFLGAEKNSYTTGVMKMHMLAAISRIYEPGIKYDIMLCLVGSQGAGKSTFFKYLAINDDWFSDNLDHLDDENIYRKLQNHWIIEMGEMKATVTAKNIEQIKSFLSRQKETYKVPYEVYPEDRPRQCVFCGTSNDLNFLPLDRTGNRRFVPYVTNWKGKGMDTRVSLKQALKSLGFQGGNKHDTELNQWINHEKEVLAEIAKQHGIEWEQKGTHEEHLDVYNFKKKERKKEVQELEQEKENLTAENEGLTSQIADARADIKLLEEEKIQFQKDKETAERRAEKAETELKKLEDRREFLQPVMDNVSKEIKEYGMIKTFLPEATALERAVTYREKKIKPLFIEMKNKIGAMAAQVKELTRERDNWKSKFQEKKKEYEDTKSELAEVQKDYQKLSGEKEILQGIADRYNRLLRMLGKDMVERLVQDDIRMQAELEAKKQKEQKEQMPKKIGDRIQWARERSEEHNAQIKKNKTKYRGMEL